MGAKERAVYLSTWADGFADIEPERLRAAFIACLRSHTFKTIPTIADVRKHLSRAEEDASTLEAEKKWERVRETIQREYNPDIPHRFSARISERTMTAIRAAGGMEWIRGCSQDQLVWCKKAFIESYMPWERLEKGRFLLPDGPVKEAFAAVAVLKSLESAKPEPEKRRQLIAAQATKQIAAQTLPSQNSGNEAV